ncbi:hypothetical protein KUCAC02_016152 [Chaenocephalus aceratus]|uniref:Uncharacterized protein n=1 Tax=Chaenocephalus aceratus TaxID=36190 RepID=A0ACB9Y087_CHAAC|nr:hypothetical protein KUCAC02_016152 [Chaenocephalus aceratus]
MDGLHIFLYVLLGVVSFTHGWTSGSELEMTVRPGENITLYCDCKLSIGVYIVWYRNCSHENQPSLVLDKNVWTKSSTDDHIMNPLPRFHFVRNFSSDTYDLLIINITETDEGLYYCGTEQLKVEKEEHITRRHLYKYSNISTKIQFNSSEPDHQETPQDCDEPQTDKQTPQTRQNQDEDVCYAAVEIRPASQRPNKKTTQSSVTYSAINTSRM